MNPDLMDALKGLASSFSNGNGWPKTAPAPKEPTDGFTLDVLQTEQSAWALSNFGVRPAWHPLLGIIEEVGELETAMLRDNEVKELGRERLETLGLNVRAIQADVEDAIGDAIVYTVDFISLMKFEAPEVLLAPTGREPVLAKEGFFIAATKLAHAFLKREQGIRGTPEQHEATIKQLLRDLYWGLDRLAVETANKKAVTIAQETWGRVKLRNWKKDAVTGGETVTP